jgi:prepilin-type N-terminal cleavage/methylation domain-containing protein
MAKYRQARVRHAPSGKIGHSASKAGGWRKFLPGEAGFTLTEIIVVLGILAIGIMPLAMVQSRARRDVTRSDLYTQAITIAQAQLEQMKGRGFGNAAPDSGQVGQIQWWANVTNVSFGMDRYDVTVIWPDGSRNRTIQVSDLSSMR